jgi:DnaJ-class molecular chaperone
MEVELKELLLGAEREIQLPSGKRLAVKIPKGSRAGQKLRFAGQGASSADIFVELQTKPDPRFIQKGATLEHELDVPLAVAVLGGEMAVPTPEGQVMLRIPAHAGRRLRIPGKGAFARGSSARGDLFVNLRITLPEARDPELEAAIRGWRERSEKKERSAS